MTRSGMERLRLTSQGMNLRFVMKSQQKRPREARFERQGPADRLPGEGGAGDSVGRRLIRAPPTPVLPQSLMAAVWVVGGDLAVQERPEAPVGCLLPQQVEEHGGAGRVGVGRLPP